MSTTTIDRSVLVENLNRARTEAEGIAQSFKVDDQGRFDISSKQYTDYKAAVHEARELKSLIEAQDAVAGIGEFLDAPERVPSAAGDVMGGAQYKSLGDMFVESDAYRASGGNIEAGRVLMADMEGKSIFNLAAGTSTVQSLGRADNLGLAEQAKRKAHVRDLFPASSTNASVLYGVRETGWVNNAAQISQRDGDAWVSAPESQLKLESVLYPVAEIAHVTRAHKNILADEPRLKTFINTRMVEGVKYKEDHDLLFGTGGAERITGLANVSGVQQYTGQATDAYSIQVRRAITKALLAEYEPTGLVISPTMWEEVEIETDDTGAFRVAVQVAIGAEKRLWQVNVVETTAMTDANFLLGAFGLGAQLHDREKVSVRVSTEDGNAFSEGTVSIRADERVALEVPRPESFVFGSWTEPTTP